MSLCFIQGYKVKVQSETIPAKSFIITACHDDWLTGVWNSLCLEGTIEHVSPHNGKVCVKKFLKLDVTIAALAACHIQVSQRGGPVQRPVILKGLRDQTCNILFILISRD